MIQTCIISIEGHSRVLDSLREVVDVDFKENWVWA